MSVASAQAYIEQTYEGGMDAYTASQNNRYAAALASGDSVLQSKLIADAARAGYSLDAGKSASLSALGISAANPLAATKPEGQWYSNNWAYSGGGAGNYVKPSAVVEALTGVPASSQGQSAAVYDLTPSLPDWLGYLPAAVVGVVVLFVVKFIFD